VTVDSSPVLFLAFFLGTGFLNVHNGSVLALSETMQNYLVLVTKICLL
jgi:hypothetical protein